ncbi:MAG: cation transporter [Acidimicrobiales bacterium]|nr:cation transporter [Acidimicrobiales bacterium]
MTTRTYLVPDITCDHCRNAIETEFAKLPAAELVEVDLNAKTVRVEGDVAEADGRAAIDEAGFDVASVS